MDRKCEDCIHHPEDIFTCGHCINKMYFKPKEENEIMKYNDYSVNVKFECKINKKITLDAKTSEQAAREIMKELSDPDILDKMVKHIKEIMLCDKDATVSIHMRQVEAETIKKKPLILLCGKSGSGKTTVADLLEGKYGLKQLKSYTTRPQRKAGEDGHLFTNLGIFSQHVREGKVIAQADINGYKYWATKEQLDNADIYVIDPKTALELAEKVKDERNVIIVYLYCSNTTRVYRMTKRGDSLEDINARSLIEYDWDDCILTVSYKRQRLDSGENDAETIAEAIMPVYNYCLNGKWT